jgi:hypothetical protein
VIGVSGALYRPEVTHEAGAVQPVDGRTVEQFEQTRCLPAMFAVRHESCNTDVPRVWSRHVGEHLARRSPGQSAVRTRVQLHEVGGDTVPTVSGVTAGVTPVAGGFTLPKDSTYGAKVAGWGGRNT